MANIYVITIIFLLKILFCISGCYSENLLCSLNEKGSTSASASDDSNNGDSSTICDRKIYDCNKFDEEIFSYAQKLEPFFEKVMSHQPLSADEAEVAIKIVKEYYTYLINHNIVYAKLARDVVNNQGLFGRIANIHLEHRIQVEGHANESKNIAINLRVGLAYRDAKLRLESKEFVSYRAIANYHYELFEQQGLSKYAWGGTLFEEFAGSGSWMRIGGYDKTIRFSLTKLTSAIILNKEVNGIKAREAFESIQHIFLQDIGKSLKAVICECSPDLCKS